MSVMIIKNTREKGTDNHIFYDWSFSDTIWTEQISSLELVTSTPISVENYPWVSVYQFWIKKFKWCEVDNFLKLGVS